MNSALHRGRKAIALPTRTADEPLPATLREFVRAWEARDLERLVTLLREDVALVMPPHPIWFRGFDDVLRFFRSERFQSFWSGGVRLEATRANGLPAFAFYRRLEDGSSRAHSLMVVRFLGQKAAEMTVFIGSYYFSGFDLPLVIDRTVSGRSTVMKGKGDHPR